MKTYYDQNDVALIRSISIIWIVIFWMVMKSFAYFKFFFDEVTKIEWNFFLFSFRQEATKEKIDQYITSESWTESERMNCQYSISIDTQSNTSCSKYLLPVQRKNSRCQHSSIDSQFLFSSCIPMGYNFSSLMQIDFQSRAINLG